MRTTRIAFALLSLLGLASAVPTPVELAPRCGTTLYPTILQQLSESSPDAIGDNTVSTTGNFHVSQAAGATSRIYQVAAFQGIPSGSYGCTLGWTLPSGYSIVSTGTPTINVTTLYKDSPSSISYPNDWSWNKFYPPSSPPLGAGLFGTTTFAAGGGATINSEVCGSSLAFVFEIATWIPGAASVDFTQYVNMLNGQGLTGVYLTYNC